MAVITKNNEDMGVMRSHFHKLSSEGIAGTSHSRGDIQDTLLDDAERLSRSIRVARSHNRQTDLGRHMSPSTKNFSEIIGLRYGIYPPKELKGTMEGDQFVLRTYLDHLGLDLTNMSFADVGKKLGFEMDLSTKDGIESFLTTGVATGTTFIIREVFLEAIRLGAIHESRVNRWIARRQPVSQRESKVPRMLDADATPTFLEEGQSIRMGSLAFNQKTVDIHEVGIGLEITDRLMEESSISMIAEFLPRVGEKMSLADEVLFVDCLLNGDQADLSEAAPKIGSDNGTAFAWKDFVRVMTRMIRMRQTPDVIISNEGDLIDLSLINEVKGFDGATTLASLGGIIGSLPRNFNSDIHDNVPSTEIVFLNSKKGVILLEMGGMKIETRRNPAKGRDELYIRKNVGFATHFRDARVIVNVDADFDSGNGWPSWMDIGAYMNSPYETGV